MFLYSSRIEAVNLLVTRPSKLITISTCAQPLVIAAAYRLL
jgi:hypothetical protein